ncbi:RluA family pseudouridine synthase [Arcobacter sp. CECT 8985]|uniref:RluA family pseudouridine synthase n=1 Tax=Arcobacter sp. CECT 8985 TaxID=1935424 RepID=UPI00100AF060|nr:RNA pseudouridine synthase [Arcobacter sp. CECT 8985]RXJ86158.1 RNA pseudouridine synthase [Arcobacter sp. CECT 8985]
MPFILKKYTAISGKKIQYFLLQNISLNPKLSQKYLSKHRVFDENKIPYEIGEKIRGDFIYIAQFEGHTRGLNPLLNFNDFALFDKPSNLMVHPISKNTKYSLLDEIRYHFGEYANLAHRIDAETSGLIIVAKNKKSEVELKNMFLEKKYKKSYLAIVEGKIEKTIKIDSKILKEGKQIGVRMTTSYEEGKESLTYIKPISYNKKKNISLVEAIPHTGRQHQIRVHLYSIGHRIVGDPIYGVEDEIAEGYLNKTLEKELRAQKTGSYRLWLHANYLEFSYKNRIYKIFSKNNLLKNHFNM